MSLFLFSSFHLHFFFPDSFFAVVSHQIFFLSFLISQCQFVPPPSVLPRLSLLISFDTIAVDRFFCYFPPRHFSVVKFTIWIMISLNMTSGFFEAWRCPFTSDLCLRNDRKTCKAWPKVCGQPNKTRWHRHYWTPWTNRSRTVRNPLGQPPSDVFEVHFCLFFFMLGMF